MSHKVKSVRYQFKCLTILLKVSNGIEKVNIVIPESFLSVQQSQFSCEIVVFMVKIPEKVLILYSSVKLTSDLGFLLSF